MAQDRWTIVAAGDEGDHLPAVFALGNGWIGMRAEHPVCSLPRIYLNGVCDRVPIDYHEGAHGLPREGDVRFSVADAAHILLSQDGQRVSLDTGLRLDLRRGTLVRTFQSDSAAFVITQFVSMANQALIITHVQASATQPVDIMLGSEIAPPRTARQHDGVYDPRITPGMANPWRKELAETDAVPVRVDRLMRSGVAVAAARSAAQQVHLEAGETWEGLSVAAYCANDSADAETLAAGARALVAQAEADGFAQLVAAHEGVWDRTWQGCDFSFAHEPTEAALRHGMFQLIQAAQSDGTGSIPAKGQTGEGYEGHIFWDAETYALPSLVYTNPAIARAMLSWRIGLIDAARANARAMDHEKGALLPWRTIRGEECSSYFLAGSAQYHINADVAHALRLYVETTGDVSLLEEGGATLLAETARIWLDLGWHDPARGSFVIDRVTGPDEYTALVDNNLYTNMMAAEHLRYVATLAERHGIDAGLDVQERAAMLAAADAMRLPYDEARQVFAQDDAFFARKPWPLDDTPDDKFPLLLHFHPMAIYRHCVAKQADAVLAMATLRHRFAPDLHRRTLAVYEPLTAHDSTLSASSFAIAAAAAQDPTKAYRYWSVTVLTDLLNLFGNCSHGLHMAALGGGWNGLAFGFAGLETMDGQLRFAPMVVPPLGDYSLSIRFQGRQVRLEVIGATARYSLVGAPVTLVHHGQPLTLGAEPIEIGLMS